MTENENAPKEQEHGFLYRFFFHNFKLKLLGALLAVLTWFPFWNASQGSCTIDLKLPIVYDAERIYIREQDKNITIRLRLQNNEGNNLQDDSWRKPEFYKDRIRVVFPNSLPAKYGTLSFNRSNLKTDLPSSILPVSMNPETVEIPYDTIETKTVPLERPAEKVEDKMVYRVQTMATHFVELRGPSRVLESIERISLKDLMPPYKSAIVNLEVNNILRESGVQVTPTAVAVTVHSETLDVQKEREYRLPVTPVMGNSPLRVTSKLPTVKVRISGGVKILEKISKDDILAYVLLEKATIAQNDKPKPVLIGGIPSGLTYKVIPAEVNVTLAEPPPPSPQPPAPPAAPAPKAAK